MFRHPHHRRRWAARLLALWLMSVVVGIAHACLVTPALLPGNYQGHDAVAHHHGHVGHHGGPQHHDDKAAAPASDDGAMDQANCRAFCEKAAMSIAPLKSALDDLQAQAPPPLVTALIVPLARQLPLQPWVPRRDGVPAPPIPIAFLRLTR